MGWSPEVVDRTAVWDFLAAWQGWQSFHAAPQGPTAPSDEAFEAAVARDMGVTIH